MFESQVKLTASKCFHTLALLPTEFYFAYFSINLPTHFSLSDCRNKKPSQTDADVWLLQVLTEAYEKISSHMQSAGVLPGTHVHPSSSLTANILEICKAVGKVIVTMQLVRDCSLTLQEGILEDTMDDLNLRSLIKVHHAPQFNFEVVLNVGYNIYLSWVGSDEIPYTLVE